MQHWPIRVRALPNQIELIGEINLIAFQKCDKEALDNHYEAKKARSSSKQRRESLHLNFFNTCCLHLIKLPRCCQINICLELQTYSHDWKHCLISRHEGRHVSAFQMKFQRRSFCKWFELPKSIKGSFLCSQSILIHLDLFSCICVVPEILFDINC